MMAHIATAAEILGTANLRFIEPSFASLTEMRFTEALTELPGDQGRLLIDEEETPVALALGDGETWIAGTFHLRKPSINVLDRFEETLGEIYQEDRATWAASVREYFSREILSTVAPAIEDMNSSRPGMVEGLVRRVWGDLPGGVCLDCGCGSGVGSHVLRRLRYSPLSYDNDASLLSLGLATGRLAPEETMCIDATRADQYVPHAPYGIGLMFGEINQFNQKLWETITRSFLSLTDNALITVGTEPEVRLVAGWVGRGCEIFENPADPLYDRWVCLTEKGA
ncbi:MAG: hypothetical protein LUQ25_01040 [Methanoregulaceae archaeon]|nr:hypothetical protein [Methanoregulaceae archaeon]